MDPADSRKSHNQVFKPSADKSTWYSPDRQYSPPRIPYVPGTSKETQYAICKVEAAVDPADAAAGTTTWTIQLAQSPGKAMAAKVNVDGAAEETY